MSLASDRAGRTPGFWFSAVRVLLLAQAAVTVVATLVNLPLDYQHLLTLQPSRGFLGWSHDQLAAAVQAAGIQPGLFAGLLLASSLFCLLCYWGMAGVIAWRKSGTWLGLLTVAMLVMLGPGFAFLGSNADLAARDPWGIYKNVVIALGWPSFFVMLYLFPNGRFAPGWTRWLAPFSYLVYMGGVFVSADSMIVKFAQWSAALYLLGGILSQFYRYRRVSGPTERQQTRWVVFALAVLVIESVASLIIVGLDPDLAIGTAGRFWHDFLFGYLWGAAGAGLVPLAIGVSILRYRLWDIDLIIRRTVLYALLSLLLGLVYYGSVLLLQQLLGGLAGQSSAALVVSTLLIVALFNPLRRRLQEAIDRRFYRAHYDSSRVVDEFAAAAVSEVGLPALSERLAGAVSTTLQPQAFGLWLSPPHSPGAEALSRAAHNNNREKNLPGPPWKREEGDTTSFDQKRV